jgi:hypothetical protein
MILFVPFWLEGPFKTEVRVGSAGSFRILCLKFAFSGDKPPFIHCSENYYVGKKMHFVRNGCFLALRQFFICIILNMHTEYTLSVFCQE